MIKVKHINAKKTATVEEENIFLLTSSPIILFISIWFPIKETDSNIVISQNVSLNISCL